MNENSISSQDSRIDHLILASAADDLQPFEVIQSKLSNWMGRVDDGSADGELSDRIFRLIGDDLMGAYLLHAEPPYITPVDPMRSKLEHYWFYITEKGKELIFTSAPNAASDDSAVVTPLEPDDPAQQSPSRYS